MEIARRTLGDLNKGSPAQLAVKILILIILMVTVDGRWTEKEIQGLDLWKLTPKRFNLYDCTGKLHTITEKMDPKPDCEDIVQKQRRERTMVTFYNPVLEPVLKKARLCKKMSVTVRTEETFLGQKKSSRTKKWMAADKQKCASYASGKVREEEESILPGMAQFGEVQEKYLYFRVITNIYEIYGLADSMVSVDVNIGSVGTPDGNVHTGCHYNDGICDLGIGGQLMWEIEEKVLRSLECPFLATNTEACIASQSGEKGAYYLAVLCTQAKVKMHIGTGLMGKDQIRHIDGCRSTGRMYRTQEGMVISFNITTSDPGDLMEAPESPDKLLDFYSLSRLVCSTEGSDICTLEATVKHADCQRDPGSTKCTVALENLDPEICALGLCKVSSYYNCDTGGAALVDVKIDVQDDLTVYADYVKKISTSKGFCVSISGSQMVAYENGYFSKAPPNSTVLYSLVDLRSKFNDKHTYRGFTRKGGYRCEGDISTKVEASTYEKAVDALRRLPSYEKWYICLRVMSDEVGKITISQTAERSPDVSDWVLEHTGKITTGSPEGSLVDARLSYLYNEVATRERGQLHRLQKEMCLQKRREWALSRSLLALDPQLYIQASRGGEMAGVVQDLELKLWKCDTVDTFRLIQTNNCTQNLNVEFKIGNLTKQGWVDRLSRRITSDSGLALPCQEQSKLLSVGKGMFVKYSLEKIMLVTQAIAMEHFDSDFVVKESVLEEDLGDLMRQQSMANKLESLSEVIYSNIAGGSLLLPDVTIFNSSSGAEGLIQSIDKWKLYWGWSHLVRNMIVVAIMLGSISLGYCCLKHGWCRKICGNDHREAVLSRCRIWCQYLYRCRREQQMERENEYEQLELGEVGTGPEHAGRRSAGDSSENRDSENLASLDTRRAAQNEHLRADPQERKMVKHRREAGREAGTQIERVEPSIGGEYSKAGVRLPMDTL